MRTALKWLGVALVVTGVAVFPFAIWFPGPWGVISLALVIIGCVLLVAAMGARAVDGGGDEHRDRPDV
jgi:hypothetical protein